MNCKYCGAALPTKGGTCPQCGKMIPMDQKKLMREMLDSRWNDYKDPNTAMYKSASNTDGENAKLGKAIAIMVLIMIIIIIVVVLSAN